MNILDYDFVTWCQDLQPIIYNSDIANKLQCWFVNYYEPIEEAPSIQPYGNTTPKQLDLSETYNHLGSQLTIRFVVKLYYNIPNIVVGGDGQASLYFYVTESRITSNQSAYNSSTQNYLRLEELNVKFSTMPYVVLFDQTPYRQNVQEKNSGGINTGFSVSFGYSFGPISLSGSFNFEDEPYNIMMNTASIPLPHDKNNGIKSTECGTLPLNYYLNKVGSSYGMKVGFMDAKENGSRTGNMQVVFEYYVNNGFDYTDSYPGTFSDTVSVRVG